VSDESAGIPETSRVARRQPHVAVTGGAQGIGRAVAVEALRRGADSVWLLDVRADQLEATRAELAALGLGAIVARRLDVGDRAAVQQLADEWSALHLDAVPTVLVNAAGVRAATGILDTDDEEWDRTIAVNLTGTFNMLRMSSRLWTGRGAAGVFVAIASIGGEVGFSERASYCASKSGVLGLVRAAALDLAPSGVRVVGISPGFIATDMSQEADESFVHSTPSGQRFAPAELAEIALDVAGSRLMTGTSIVADGGLLAGYRL
jgi:NAD(P)-dependent dehydrogenase (short-subunit alcohol dehydrogenase family)